MVFVTRINLGKRWRTNFLDQLRVYIKGGGGGQGYPSHGGLGGAGGDVYVRASEHVTLKTLKGTKRYTGGTGENSRIRALQGAPGKAVVINVPVGVCVTTDDGSVLGNLNKNRQQVLVARGGRGGYKDNNWSGEKGDRLSIKLILKLLADVGLVGFPNAGKSTLLKAMSRTQPKIADYPFTTVRPQIGIIEYQDQRQISLADLPGLIEGASMNYGMGHQFLRHIERTKLLLFVVDVHGFQLSGRHPFRSAVEMVMLLNRELELYKAELLEKPAILALNKIDVDGSEELVNETRRILRERHFTGIAQELRPQTMIDFEEIICLSAKEGQGLEVLRESIRTVIDEDAERRRQDDEEQEAHCGS